MLMDNLTAEDLPFLREYQTGVGGNEYFFQLSVPSGVQSDAEILQEYDSDIAAWLRRAAKDIAQHEGEIGYKAIRDARWKAWEKHSQERSESQ